jgi:hypothetical protein
MTPNQALTPGAFDPEDEKWEEEWLVVMNTKGEYTLSKVQARILQQAVAQGNRGIVMFTTFAISIPYIAEFYRTKRYLKGVKALPARATEEVYKPIDQAKFEEWRKKVYEKIGRPMPKEK